MTEPRDPALPKFLWLTLARVAGLVVAAVGILLWRTTAFGASDEETGRILLVAGLFLSLMVPALLARHWRRRG